MAKEGRKLNWDERFEKTKQWHISNVLKNKESVLSKVIEELLQIWEGEDKKKPLAIGAAGKIYIDFSYDTESRELSEFHKRAFDRVIESFYEVLSHSYPLNKKGDNEDTLGCIIQKKAYQLVNELNPPHSALITMCL